jgi:hypothetical protein
VHVGWAVIEQVPTLEVTESKTKPPESSRLAPVCVADWFPALAMWAT